MCVHPLITLSLLTMLLFFQSEAHAGDPQSGRVLFNGRSEETVSRCRVVNDDVMGGRSRSRVGMSSGGIMQFSGDLSLENNGGFASFRMPLEQQGLDSMNTIVARVRGDGRTYRLNLYDNTDLSGVSFRQYFETKADQWIEVEFPLKAFTASWRGRELPQMKLDESRVKGIGFLLGDKKPGPFRIEIDWVRLANREVADSGDNSDDES